VPDAEDQGEGRGKANDWLWPETHIPERFQSRLCGKPRRPLCSAPLRGERQRFARPLSAAGRKLYSACGLIVIKAGMSFAYDKRPHDIRLEATSAVVAAHARRLKIGDHRRRLGARKRRFTVGAIEPHHSDHAAISVVCHDPHPYAMTQYRS
jgi:hypothetical protein